MNSWLQELTKNPLFVKSANSPTSYTLADLKMSGSSSLELPVKKQAEDSSFTESNSEFNTTITMGEQPVEMDIRDIGAAIAMILGTTKPVAELTKDDFYAWVVDMEAVAQTEESIRNSLEFLRSTETELRKQSGDIVAAPFDLKDVKNYPLFIWALAVNVKDADKSVAPSLIPATTEVPASPAE